VACLVAVGADACAGFLVGFPEVVDVADQREPLDAVREVSHLGPDSRVVPSPRTARISRIESWWSCM